MNGISKRFLSLRLVPLSGLPSVAKSKRNFSTLATLLERCGAPLGGGAARRMPPPPPPPSPPDQHAAAPPSEVLRQVGPPPRSCPADLVAPGPAHQRVAARIDRRRCRRAGVDDRRGAVGGLPQSAGHIGACGLPSQAAF